MDKRGLGGVDYYRRRTDAGTSMPPSPIPCGTNANFTNSTNYAKTIIFVKLA